jgi:biopolymer transport protein ExbD
MIRLIDVALIILLGFIAISRLKSEYVDLPSAGDIDEQIKRQHLAQIYVYKNYSTLVDGRDRWRCTTLQKLQNILIGHRERLAKQRAKLVVTIEPQKSCIMQNLVDVLDVCQRNNISKNLNYESIN